LNRQTQATMGVGVIDEFLDNSVTPRIFRCERVLRCFIIPVLRVPLWIRGTLPRHVIEIALGLILKKEILDGLTVPTST